MRIISTLFGLVLILGFAVGASGQSAGTNAPVRLTPAMFTGYEFTLISDKDYSDYYFSDNGSVEESFGGKGKHDGIVALGEGWRIEHGNTLVFTGAPDGIGAVPNPVRHTLQFKSFGKKIVVTADGDRYRRSKLKSPD
ncbi:MAG TPA: hypothetical protein VGI03_15165 [Verrucomicrobiae bacterium]|jgi:hypothetical protein